MASDDAPGETNHLSVSEMRTWLQEELRNVLKECELRVRDATAFTTAYAMGELTAEGAHERFRQYDHRWGEALEGIHASSYETDAAITAAIDRRNASQYDTPTWAERQHEGPVPKKPPGPQK